MPAFISHLALLDKFDKRLCLFHLNQKGDKKMTKYVFDDSLITWHQLPGLDNFYLHIFAIDRELQIADVIFKFLPHEPIILHRHCTLNHSLVIHGEHRLFHVDGSLKEVRPVGSYTVGEADLIPHRECGGDEGAIVLFSIRGTRGLMYELMDDQQNSIDTVDMDLLEAFLEVQNNEN